MSEEKLRKELSKHPLVADIRKSRKGYYIVALKSGVFTIKDGKTRGEIFPDTMTRLQALLEGYSDDQELRKERLAAVESEEAEKRNEAERNKRRERTVNVRATEKYPLAEMMVGDCDFEMGSLYIPPFCKNVIGRIVAKDPAGLDQWRDSSLATVGLEIERLTKIKNDLEAMDIASYQEAFRKLQAKYNRYVETGEMSCD